MAAVEKGPKLKINAFDIEGDRINIGMRWEKWVSRFERELLYNGCCKKTKGPIAQMALLIYAGHEVEDIHDSLPQQVKPEGTPAMSGTGTANPWLNLTVISDHRNRTTSHYMS